MTHLLVSTALAAAALVITFRSCRSSPPLLTMVALSAPIGAGAGRAVAQSAIVASGQPRFVRVVLPSPFPGR